MVFTVAKMMYNFLHEFSIPRRGRAAALTKRHIMTLLKSLIPLTLLVVLLLVACEQQQTVSKPMEISQANKATAVFAVEGMT